MDIFRTPEQLSWLKAYDIGIKRRGHKDMRLITGDDKVWERAPTGTHAAWCVSVIDLGAQYSPKYDSTQNKVRIEWELSEERTTTGDLFLVGREYNNFVTLSGSSLFKKALESWRGVAFDKEGLESFDIANLLGKPCMLTLIENTSANGKTYTNVEAVTAPPKGLQMTPSTTEPLLFDFETRDNAAWMRLPDWLQKRIQEATNWQQGPELQTAAEAEADLNAGQGEVIPF